jgi:DNA-binding LacI/PurR family transcriptional regulator
MMAQAFMASGVSVPQDKSIISIGGLPREMLIGWDIPMTRVNVNYRLMAQEAARLLVTESRAAIHKPVPATLEKGQTITMLDSSGVSPDNK